MFFAEQHVGLELLKAASPYKAERLHYWQRAQRNGNAEVDYVIQKGTAIIPIEVKSGTRGTMQSLRLFMEEKSSPVGIRVANENFSRFGNVMVYPLYAVSRIIDRD